MASSSAKGIDQVSERATEAIQLPHQHGIRLAPEAKRPRSDNKGIESFSKVLADVMSGIAPITAAKRLSHWHPKEEYLEKTREGRIIHEASLC